MFKKLRKLFNKKEVQIEDVSNLAEELKITQYETIDLSQVHMILHTGITTSKRCPMCNHLIFINDWESKIEQIGNTKIFKCPYCETEMEIH